jgi:hypothetical protein
MDSLGFEIQAVLKEDTMTTRMTCNNILLRADDQRQTKSFTMMPSFFSEKNGNRHDKIIVHDILYLWLYPLYCTIIGMAPNYQHQAPRR